MENTNILKAPMRVAKAQEGDIKVTIVDIAPHYGVEWCGNSNSDVVDIKVKLPDGYIIKQRVPNTFSTSSIFGTLIRAAKGLHANTFICEIDLDDILGKEVIGEIYHYQHASGDVVDKIRNFRAS